MKLKIVYGLSLFILLVVAVICYSYHIANLMPDQQHTLVWGRSSFAPGSRASIGVKVLDNSRQKPIPEAQVEIYLDSERQGMIPLATAQTDAKGDVRAVFDIPDIPEGRYTVVVKTASAAGEDREKIPVQIKKHYKILLSTDKPLYQPGQTVHVRTLVVRQWNLQPVQKQPIVVEISDPKGNKVFKRKLTLSNFGTAAADFTLAAEVNQGAYRIKATCFNAEQEKEITVKSYVLPKFKITAEMDRNFYSPGQRVTGRMHGRYFFGKPVARGQVAIVVSTFDVNWQARLTLSGKTDAAGGYHFEFDLPRRLWGIPMLKGAAMVKVEIKLTDTAAHTEKISRELSVSSKPLHVVAIPASPHLVPNVPNPIYLCTTYPDGTPAITDVTVGKKTLHSDKLGITKFSVLPDQIQDHQLKVKVRDRKGAEIVTNTRLGYRGTGDFFIALDRPVYQSGDVMKIEVITTRDSGYFYLDIIKHKQTLVTHILERKAGKWQLEFTLPQDISGTLLVDVYRVAPGQPQTVLRARKNIDRRRLRPGRNRIANDFISRDTRAIFVSPADDLKISAQLDKDSYRPGEKATIGFEVKDGKDRRVESALAIAVVDESVFFLQEMQPGLEKVYFMLQQELLKPRYQIRYHPPVSYREIVAVSSPKTLDQPEIESIAFREKEQAIEVMFAMARVQPDPGFHKNSFAQKQRQMEEIKENYFRTLFTCLASLPFAVAILAGFILAFAFGHKMLKRRDEHYS